MRYSIKCVTVRCLIVIMLLTATGCIFQLVRVSRYSENMEITGEYYNEDVSPVVYDTKPPCEEVVHIGLVCTGYKSNVQFHTMLKSMFFYRNSALHFHIIVNDISENTLKILFQTWSVPEVYVSFYNINNTIADVQWIPNTHYSGIYGLTKLTFPKIISPKITSKIIIIDTDLTFTANIYELWSIFDQFNVKQAIGLVENQSKYYLGKLGVARPWPALGQGFNTGVMLFRLDRLRALEWDKLWVRVAKKTVPVFGKSRLADQDVINAVIKQQPYLVYRLPCQWNTQLSLFTQSSKCYNRYEVKIIHWNNVKKVDVDRADWKQFKKIYAKFNEYDGSILKQGLGNCTRSSKSTTHKPQSVCSEIKELQKHQWRTLLFFNDYKYTPVKDDVTFVAQLSFERLSIVEELSRLWSGPISVTFYITDAQLQNCQNFIRSSKVLKKRSNIAYHAVFKEGDFYPINVLRNTALRNIMTPYVFLVDIDFMPTKYVYENIKRHIGSMTTMEKKALIIPAFETRTIRSSAFPQTKKKLLKKLDSNAIFPFRFRIWKAGHAPTNFTMWRTALFPYKIKWAPDFEPYVVVQRNVTEYDNRFIGFGWNKVAHIMELQAQNYTFIVLPDTFIVHKIHASSSDVTKFRQSFKYRRCMQVEKKNFKKYLRMKYGYR